jgi:cobalt-zinc-cadmium efflux system membrane fusion protein
VFILTAKKSVLTDRSAITRAENTLRAWNIPQDEIDEVKREAEKADDLDRMKIERTKKTRKEKDAALEKAKREQLDRWARVELRAPFDGIIVERNIVPGEIVQDPTTNLFQIAQVHRLLVIANAPEDELPNLHALQSEERQWTVKTVGRKAATELKGPIEEIGQIIDPNQHTAVIKGYIDNPGEYIRSGQFISATIRIPPPPDVVEVPLDAVVEDGQTCVVFVQTDPTKHHYTMRRVQVMHRFASTAFVRSTPFTEQEKLTPGEKEQNLLPLEPLRSGERILKTGVGELKAALLDLESRPPTQTTEGKTREALARS